ncbi:MAG: VTC domain-containing protein, partial [Planctomycetota bacterium]
MTSAPWATDRTLRSRFECKYLVTEEMATEIRRHVAPFVHPDYFTERSPGNRYPVHSLYLDTPRLELYETTCQGMKNRFKLRIRGYDGKPDSPLFAEVKRKADRVILKRRALISRDDAMALLRGGRVACRDHGVGIWITSSLRDPTRGVAGAVVDPARMSNHHVG